MNSSKNVRTELFDVVNTHGISKHSEVVYVPLPKLFKTDSYHTFFIYTVDKRYDGLIGVDL